METARGPCLSILAALAAIVLAVLGGGNAVSTIPEADFVETALELQTEHDPDLAPAPYRLIEATPTPAAIAIPTVTAAASRSEPVENCPAVIVDIFGEHAPAACAVAWCESRYSAWAIGDAGASLGLFQIQPRWHQWRVPGEDLTDPAVNTRAAWLISSGGTDWSAWTCKPW